MGGNVVAEPCGDEHIAPICLCEIDRTLQFI
jgi:hypothetical protein